jgi:nicotinamidase/pyrazinamidase
MKLYLDVDTQMDFVFPAGALYVPGAEKILARVGELNREASEVGARLVSTADAHTPNDVEFQSWPPHCVKAALGARKPEITQSQNARLLEKRHVNCFTNPQFEEWLREWEIGEALVYGVVTEICVRHAAIGLLERGIQVTVETSAVRELTAQGRDLFFEEVRARGGRLTHGAETR